MKELLLALMVWISANTNYEFYREAPNVTYVSYETLHHMQFGDKVPFDKNKPIVDALYVFEQETIYLPLGFKPDSPTQLAVLVHELVHHIQTLSERKWPCPAAMELEAYSIQEKFLRSMGLELADMGTNWLFVAMVSMCRRPSFDGHSP